MQRQSRDVRLRAIPKATQEHDRFARTKRHCIILAILFALMLAFLPAKRKAPSLVDTTVPTIDTTGTSTTGTSSPKPSPRDPRA
ncbi:MAG TPA: hypothetical protein VIG57_00700 [Candidatus Entotheonella sp.]|jgi:hypothetical protein